MKIIIIGKQGFKKKKAILILFIFIDWFFYIKSDIFASWHNYTYVSGVAYILASSHTLFQPSCVNIFNIKGQTDGIQVFYFQPTLGQLTAMIVLHLSLIHI